MLYFGDVQNLTNATDIFFWHIYVLWLIRIINSEYSHQQPALTY